MKFYKLVDHNPQSKTYMQPQGIIRCIGDKLEWFKNDRWVYEKELRSEICRLIVNGSDFQEITITEVNDLVKMLLVSEDETLRQILKDFD